MFTLVIAEQFLVWFFVNHCQKDWNKFCMAQPKELGELLQDGVSVGG